MTPDPDLLTQPVAVLGSWGGGLALAAAVVSWWRVVGAGFAWLAAGSTALVLGWGVLSDDRIPFVIALAALAVAAVMARRSPVATAAAFAVAGMAGVYAAAAFAGWPLAISAAVALGGVTGEMMLGHWYLVDPTLPRWALKGLDSAGVVGLVADAALLGLLAPVSIFTVSGATALAYVALAGMSILLMVLVWFALDQPAYSGVMAATGLSYLAVLTALGAVFLGRAIGSGFTLFEGI